MIHLAYKWQRLVIATTCALGACLAATAWAQGPVLLVQPGNTVRTVAGNGMLGYSGDAATAVSATLATPAAVAYDRASDLFIADADNNVIREVNAAGTITTVAGSGMQGFAGDGGPATSALLDTPTGVAVDSSGNLYIADSHNQRVRMVNAQGNISTIAGNGTAGYSGDGGAATSASLFLPEAVAVDSAGSLYIADTDNYRIRKISGGVITTVAGDGEQIYSGDGAAAISAGLDTPTGIAVDARGNLYVADSHNQRIRMVSAQGIISTIAGNGTTGYSGDSGNAIQATLAKPTGVTVDSQGNVYIVDSQNNVIRQVGNGVINTIVGNGQEGYAGDNGPAIGANLDTPRAAALDPLGDIAIADRLNQRIRTMDLPALTFASQPTGTVSAPQSVTLSNTGSASLLVQTIGLSGDFTQASGGTCTAAPISLAVGASCSIEIAFAPTAAGAASGSVVFNGVGITPQTLLLNGNGAGFAATIALSESPGASVVYGTPLTVTATLSGQNGTPSGNVTYTVDGANPQSAALSSSGVAQFTLPGTLSVRTHTVLVSYAGDANYTLTTPSQSFALIVVIPASFSLQATPTSLQITQGQSGNTTLLLTPVGGYSGTITFSCSNLPANATCAFTQNPVQLTGSNQQTQVILTIKTSVQQAHSEAPGRTPRGPLNPLFLALALWWPGGLAGLAAIGRKRSKRQRRFLLICLLLLATGVLAGGLSGCGSGGFGPYVTPPGATTVRVTATATSGTSATPQTVNLTLTIVQ
ncbi:MAG: choice-of-anchor D domain-containing protein [Silvibacterium sp.]